MAKKGSQEEQPVIIVKKVIKKGGGHHGGAWKVAYADFVTAMMAFFLLLWLLNVSTDDALEVISSYFDPAHPQVADTRSGAGGVMGGLSMMAEGALTDTMQKPVPPETTGYNRDTKKSGEKSATIENLEEQLRKAEDERFEKAKQELEQALQENEELQELAKHLKIDITPEGLRIQIVDQEGKPMFALGSARMLPEMERLLAQVTTVVQSMPNEISVRGHTDSYQYAPGATYTNWELSSDRANAARRELLNNGVEGGRLNDVMGKADTEHLVEDNPLDPRNRRISIILLRETVEQAYERGEFGQLPEEDVQAIEDDAAAQSEYPNLIEKPEGSFQKTPGAVYFP